MREGFKKSHINIASRIILFFMQAILSRQAALARLQPLVVPKGYDNSSGRRLPKGFRNHNPAGSKIAKLAENQMCTKKC